MLRIELLGKPLALNATSKSSHWQASKEIAQWREDAAWTVKAKRLKPLEGPVTIHVYPQTSGRLTDCASCVLAVKGIVDGLVDANLLVDDSPKYVEAITFHSPRKAKQDGLTITIYPEWDTDEEP